MELEKLVHWRVDRELRKKVIKAGDYDVVPYEDAKCIVVVSSVRCRDNEGQECLLGVPSVLLDSQSVQSLIEWRVGAAENGLDRDLELVLRQMCRDEQCIARLIYRSRQGRKVRDISCELHLKDVEERALVANWSWEQLVCTAERHKERGVVLIREGRLRDAFSLFSKAFKFLVALEPLDLADLPVNERPRILDLKAKLYNNMAHCQLEAQCWEEAAWLAARALALRPRDAKALYRRGAARAALGLHEDAWTDLQAALRERPGDAAARRARDALEPTIRRINRDYTTLVKKMFS